MVFEEAVDHPSMETVTGADAVLGSSVTELKEGGGGGGAGPRVVSESSIEETGGRTTSRLPPSTPLTKSVLALPQSSYATESCMLGKRKHACLESNNDNNDAIRDEEDSSSPTTQAGLKLLFAASLLQQKSPKSMSVATNINVASAAASSTTHNHIPQRQLQQQQEQQTAIAVVKDPLDKDVLCGRGGFINKHKGNLVYRRVVEYNKSVYQQVPKRHRILVSQSIVQTISQNGGRFLQYQNGMWTTISFRRAVQKTSQALREKSDSKEPPTASGSSNTKSGSSSSTSAAAAVSA